MSDFKDILGNENIIEHMMLSYQQNKVSHAYIIEGEKGSGKKTIAESFAKLLMCQEHGEEACGHCRSCIQIEHGDHPDVISVTHQKPATLSVDDIRDQIVGTVDVIPYVGPYKIYIVDEAEKMNEAAQNALLKTIEEPPEYAVILLLTTNRGAFLPTILSRCILLSTRPVPDALVKQYLTSKLGIDEGVAEFCTRFAMGNIGRAVECAQSEDFMALRDKAVSLLSKIHDISIPEMDAYVKTLKNDKNHMDEFLDIFVMWFRDLLFLKTLKESEGRDYRVFKNEYASLLHQSKNIRLENLNDIFQKVGNARARLRANVNFEMTLEMMILDIRDAFA